jgi:hypothetical protein
MVSEFLVKEQSLQTARPTHWLGATSYSYGGRNIFDLDPLSDRILVRKRDIDPDAENQKESRVILFQNFYEHLLEKVSQ